MDGEGPYEFRVLGFLDDRNYGLRTLVLDPKTRTLGDLYCLILRATETGSTGKVDLTRYNANEGLIYNDIKVIGYSTCRRSEEVDAHCKGRDYGNIAALYNVLHNTHEKTTDIFSTKERNGVPPLDVLKTEIPEAAVARETQRQRDICRAIVERPEYAEAIATYDVGSDEYLKAVQPIYDEVAGAFPRARRLPRAKSDTSRTLDTYGVVSGQVFFMFQWRAIPRGQAGIDWGDVALDFIVDGLAELAG